jgi:spermidine synthase
MDGSNSSEADREGLDAANPVAFALITAIFLLSGAAGLVYQVLWMRSLGLFFGSDMYGISIILSTFMAGLALGSLLGGRLAQRTNRPLMWYGLAEIGIGLVALPFHAILNSFDPLLTASYGGTAAEVPWSFHALRALLAGGVLLVPTTLMGTTLPLIMRHFVRSRRVLGESGAYFYAVNTLGALLGTLTAGFALLPQLGMAKSTLCAALINLGIGSVCVVLGLRSAVPSEAAIEEVTSLDPLPGMEAKARLHIANVALIAFGVSGFCSFALEVLWTRILLISFSATVYSFAATLACFLFGIVLGTRLIAKVVDRHTNPVWLFAVLELGCGVSVAVLALALHALPGAFGSLLGALAAALPGGNQHALVVAALVASFPLLVIPASLLGATFPVALRIYTTNVAQVGRRTGNIYAANTLGAVMGSLTGGLVLIPLLGAMASLVLVAALFLGIGLWLASVAPREGLPDLRPRLGVAVITTFACGIAALLIPYRVTLNFNQSTLADAELLYHAEGIQNTIDVVRSKSGATSLIIGGNVEADNGYRQRRHFVLKGHLPLMLQSEPATVLVVGLGMGITLQTTARHPGLERIDVIELSPDILAAQEHLGDVNGNVVENPLVHVRIDDGRLFMKLTRERFDMITADPIHPKVSRVGYLYTHEYYESIRSRLNEGGVVCQWMPIYQISPLRLRSAIKSFVKAFPDATLWYVEGHALLVSKLDDSPIDYQMLEHNFDDAHVREDLESIDIDSAVALVGHLIMGPDQIRSYIADSIEPVPLNTDDYPYLEYFVPTDLFFTSTDNVREFAKHLAQPADLAKLVSNLPPQAIAWLEASSESRKQGMLQRQNADKGHQ